MRRALTGAAVTAGLLALCAFDSLFSWLTAAVPEWLMGSLVTVALLAILAGGALLVIRAITSLFR